MYFAFKALIIQLIWNWIRNWNSDCCSCWFSLYELIKCTIKAYFAYRTEFWWAIDTHAISDAKCKIDFWDGLATKPRSKYISMPSNSNARSENFSATIKKIFFIIIIIAVNWILQTFTEQTTVLPFPVFFFSLSHFSRCSVNINFKC